VYAGWQAVLVVAGLVALSGMVNVAATVPSGAMDGILAGISDRSVAHHAGSAKNPLGDDAKAIAGGLPHYKENCLDCHGAPGIEPAEFAKGLNPAAPELTEADDLSDAEIFWIVSNGIRMTGMPAFSPTHNDEERWEIVAFVRHLTKLTDDEKKALQAGREEPEVHHAKDKEKAKG
jgi:mono/diheme cytochrome c family protein